jgi:hypothetical protein
VETYNNNINLTKHPDIINASMKVTQNDKDTNEIVVRVFNNDGTEIDYSGISTAQILFTKPDYRTVQGNMTVRENDLYYKMGTNEIACTGKVVAQVQLLGADGARLTVGGFRFEVIQDPVTPWSVQSTSEYGILQQLVADLEAIDVVDLTNQFNAHKAESASKHIRESGSNTNGSYIKFDDGTMVCYHRATYQDVVMTQALGTAYTATLNYNWVFAAAFTSVPSVSLTQRVYLCDFIWINDITSTTASFRPSAFTSKTNAVPVLLLAIGRWK